MPKDRLNTLASDNLLLKDLGREKFDELLDPDTPRFLLVEELVEFCTCLVLIQAELIHRVLDEFRLTDVPAGRCATLNVSAAHFAMGSAGELTRRRLYQPWKNP